MKCEICQMELDSCEKPLNLKDKLIIFAILTVAILIWISAIYGVIKYLE